MNCNREDIFQDIIKICLRQDRPLVEFGSKAPKERNLLALGETQGYNRQRKLPSAGPRSPYGNEVLCQQDNREP
ncbi:MAG TPA: hypothetical protein DEQ87_12280 [Algoriphagus sp.]|nr:hypothetical protein [Algoriphagus sp.]MAN87981.1 hypothetical protein [Algoriphagus sp.]HAD51331.1 hypothetical protein [Algoriphagus sp.]HAH38448.1 hypothetical protein [Algoriphagus sp.]HAS58995.1 hypothetical protein [Algoriphagus sp.]